MADLNAMRREILAQLDQCTALAYAAGQAFLHNGKHAPSSTMKQADADAKLIHLIEAYAQAHADGMGKILEGRNSQHVLKAEGASPDATDRENCANASPGGGPTGVGQSAAADPAGVPEPLPQTLPPPHVEGKDQP